MITDLIMPDSEGLETIQALRNEFPALPVAAMSGGFSEQFLKVAQLLGAGKIIHKPIEAQTLRLTVRGLLETGVKVT